MQVDAVARGGLDGDLARAPQQCRSGVVEGRGKRGEILGHHRERDHSLRAPDLFGRHHQERAAPDRQHRARAAVHRDLLEAEERLEHRADPLDVGRADHEALEP